MPQKTREPYLYELGIILSTFIGMMAYSLYSDIEISIPIFITWFTMIALGKRIGLNYSEMIDSIRDGIGHGLNILLIIAMIGILVGSWTKGGIVVTIIYYGLKTIIPWLFLPSTVLLCSATSVITGTSWGTVGTIGIAMMEIGRSMGIPAPIVAGAILSGAYFGDKLSLLSDSVILSSTMSKVNIYEHIKSLLPVSLSSLVLTLIVFYTINQQYITIGDTSKSEIIINAIENKFVISPISTIPMFVVIVLLNFQVPAAIVLAIGSLFGIIIGILVQEISFVSALSSIYSNEIFINPDLPEVDSYILDIMSHGGLKTMKSSLIVKFLGLGLSGLMVKLKFIKIISESIEKRIKNLFQINIWTMFTALLCNMLACSMGVALIMTPKIMYNIYEKMGIDRRVMSRSSEIGGTLTCAMIPWTDNGIYMSKMLGLSSFEYAPYMLLSIFAILINTAFGYFNIFMYDSKKQVLQQK